jgi:hypothetical protein
MDWLSRKANEFELHPISMNREDNLTFSRPRKLINLLRGSRQSVSSGDLLMVLFRTTLSPPPCCIGVSIPQCCFLSEPLLARLTLLFPLGVGSSSPSFSYPLSAFLILFLSILIFCLLCFFISFIYLSVFISFLSFLLFHMYVFHLSAFGSGFTFLVCFT